MAYNWDADTAAFQIAVSLASPQIGDPRGYPVGWNERAQFDKIFQWCKNWLDYSYEFDYHYPATPPSPTLTVNSTLGAENTSYKVRDMKVRTGEASSYSKSISWHITSGISVGISVTGTIGAPGVSSIGGSVSTNLSLEVRAKRVETNTHTIQTTIAADYDVPLKYMFNINCV